MRATPTHKNHVMPGLQNLVMPGLDPGIHALPQALPEGSQGRAPNKHRKPSSQQTQP